MKHFFNPKVHALSVQQLLKWSALSLPVALLAGSASALFLWSLERVTRWRWEHGWLLFLLPLAGLAVGLMYYWFGRSAEGGNNLIVDEIHEPGGGVPARMAPLVLLGTLMTHLFGGSAGREGTAVQMGGSLASWFGRSFGFAQAHRRVLLMAGVAAGFGSVFGTPLAGAVFAMEVLSVGRVQYEAVIPVLIASVGGDLVCSAWGIKHTAYHIQFAGVGEGASLLHLDLALLGKVAAAGLAFGLGSLLFAELTHTLQKGFKQYIPFAPLRPVVGGALVIAGVYALGTRDYLGIGVSSPDGGVCILSAFQPDGAHGWSWLWKILFTAVTLSSGFKGGEVTPLFFIGATLGNALAWAFHAPVDLFAGLGFVAVFAGAANTPLACTLMGLELFGAQHAVYFATACFLAYYFSGHSGIYLSQRVSVPKRHLGEIPSDIPLREARTLSRDLADAGLVAMPGLGGLFNSDTTTTDTDHSMPHQHKIAVTEMGKVRIYLTPSEKVKPGSLWERLNAKPVYREIIRAAKQDGLMNAVAFPSQHGFSNGGAVQSRDPELGNPRLTMCVELVDHKDKLERFCLQHGELLKGKVIVYKHVEHWSIQKPGLVEKDAVADEG